MKRIIVLFLLVAALSRSLYAFSLSVGSNRVKVSQTSTVTVGDISGSPTSYEWSADIGSISGSGASVTYTAPAVKGKATISVTVKNGTTTLWSGTVQILVYKSIIVIKTDDYWYCEWNSPTYIRPNYKIYIDYMADTAKVKTSVGMCAGSAIDPAVDATGAFANATKAYLNTGYVEIYNHSYDHSCQATKDLATLDTEFQQCESLAWSKLGVHLRGYGSPGSCVPAESDNLVTAVNNAPEIKYIFGFAPPYDDSRFNCFSFSDPNSRLNCENSSFAISYSQFQSEYASKKDRAVNFIQIHPVWWDTPGTSMAQWQLIIADMKAEGVTVILPYEYVRMLNEPAFVPDEGPGSTPADTTAPGNITTVNDGTGTDIDTTNSTTQLSANWTASTDAESGISGYKYAIGTAAGGTQTAGWTTLGNVTTVTRTGLSLSNGTGYYFTVKAINGSGLESASATNSDGQTVSVINPGDTTPPGAPASVRDGTGTDVSSTLSATQLSANWDAATDNESAITLYEYAIGTTPGGANIRGWTSNGTTPNVTASGLALTVGTIYYFSVRATSSGGTGSARNSNGQVVTTVTDTTPPTTPSATTYPNPFSLSGPGGMTFVVSAQAQGELKIYTMNGKLIKTLTGTNTISWDGTNEDNEKVARGIYIYRITDETGSKTGKITVTK